MCACVCVRVYECVRVYVCVDVCECVCVSGGVVHLRCRTGKSKIGEWSLKGGDGYMMASGVQGIGGSREGDEVQ